MREDPLKPHPATDLVVPTWAITSRESPLCLIHCSRAALRSSSERDMLSPLVPHTNTPEQPSSILAATLAGMHSEREQRELAGDSRTAPA